MKLESNNCFFRPLGTLVSESVNNINGSDVKELKKKAKNKSITASDIKNKVAKVLAHDPQTIVNEVPSLLDLVTDCIVFGVPAVVLGPVLTIPVIIATKIIRDTADAKVIGKYISTYNIKIANLNRKIEKMQNQDDKDTWIEYRKELEAGRDKLMSKKNELRINNDLFEAVDTEAILESFLYFQETVNALDDDEYSMIFDDEDMLSEGVVDEAKMKAKTIKQTIKRKERAMDRWFQKTLKDIRDTSRNDQRNKLVERQVPKLSKMIKRSIVIGAAFAVDPAIAGITALVTWACGKNAKEKERKRLLTELSQELELVEEKIKDADNNGEKDKKYQLMRVKQKLNTNIAKLKNYI